MWSVTEQNHGNIESISIVSGEKKNQNFVNGEVIYAFVFQLTIGEDQSKYVHN